MSLDQYQYNPLLNSYKLKGIHRNNRPEPLPLENLETVTMLDLINLSGIRSRSGRVTSTKLTMALSTPNLLTVNEKSDFIPILTPLSSQVSFNNIPITLILIQMGELFINVGLRSVLTFYVGARSGLDNYASKHITHLFGALIYMSPMIIGIISDIILGECIGIVLSCLFLIIGLTILFITSLNPFNQYYYPNLPISYIIFALFLISLGLGGLKPNLNTLACSQIKQSKEAGFKDKLLGKYFDLSFMATTIAAFVSSLLIPTIVSTKCYGLDRCYPFAFGLLLLVSLSIFILFLNRLRAQGLPSIKPSIKDTFNSIYINRINYISNFKLLFKSYFISSPLMFFWMLYDQSTTVWQYQYEKMDKEWLFSGLIIPTELTSSITSLLVIVLLIVLIFWLDPFLIKHSFKFRDIPRMLTAFFILILAYIISNLLQMSINNSLESGTAKIIYDKGRVIKCENCIPGSYQLLQLTLQALAEALLGTSAPLFSYTQGGDIFPNFSQGLMYFNNSLGNFLVYFVDKFILEGVNIVNGMWVYTGMAITAASLFLLLFIIVDKN